MGLPGGVTSLDRDERQRGGAIVSFHIGGPHCAVGTDLRVGHNGAERPTRDRLEGFRFAPHDPAAHGGKYQQAAVGACDRGAWPFEGRQGARGIQVRCLDGRRKFWRRHQHAAGRGAQPKPAEIIFRDARRHIRQVAHQDPRLSVALEQHNGAAVGE